MLRPAPQSAAGATARVSLDGPSRTLVAVHATYLLVDVGLVVQLPPLVELEPLHVGRDVLAALVIERDQQFIIFIDLRIPEKFDAPNMVRIAHVLVGPAGRVLRVHGLDVVTVAVNVALHFPHEGIPSTLQHDTDREVRIVVLLFQTGLNQLMLRGHVTRLLLGQLLTHDLEAAGLRDDELLMTD